MSKNLCSFIEMQSAHAHLPAAWFVSPGETLSWLFVGAGETSGGLCWILLCKAVLGQLTAHLQFCLPCSSCCKVTLWGWLWRTALCPKHQHIQFPDPSLRCSWHGCSTSPDRSYFCLEMSCWLVQVQEGQGGCMIRVPMPASQSCPGRV